MPVRDIWKVKVGTYILEAFDIKRPKVVTDTVERGGNPAGLDKSVGVIAGKKRVEFGFSTYAKHLSGEGEVPTITDLLQAAGFKVSATDSDSDGTDDTYTYTPKALSDASTFVDIEMQADTGYYVSINDAVVKRARLIFKVGEPLIVEFELVGQLYTENTTGTITANFDTKEPFVVKSLTLGADVPTCFETLEIEINNDVAERVDPTDANGVCGHIITRQEITGTIDPEVVLKNPEDVLTTFSVLVGSSSDGITIEGAKVMVKDRDFADRDGLLLTPLTLGFYPSAAGSNDALTITFKKVVA